MELWEGYALACKLAEQRRMDTSAWDDDERREASERSAPTPLDVQPGDRVQLTAERMASMYGHVRPKRSKFSVVRERWTVIACECGLCKQGGYVAIEGGGHFAAQALERVDLPRQGPGLISSIRKGERWRHVFDAVHAEVAA